MLPSEAAPGFVDSRRSGSKNFRPLAISLTRGEANSQHVSVGQAGMRVSLPSQGYRHSVGNTVLPVLLGSSRHDVMRVHAPLLVAEMADLAAILQAGKFSLFSQQENCLMTADAHSVQRQLSVASRIGSEGPQHARSGRRISGQGSPQPRQRFAVGNAASVGCSVATDTPQMRAAHALLHDDLRASRNRADYARSSSFYCARSGVVHRAHAAIPSSFHAAVDRASSHVGLRPTITEGQAYHG